MEEREEERRRNRGDEWIEEDRIGTIVWRNGEENRSERGERRRGWEERGEEEIRGRRERRRERRG